MRIICGLGVLAGLVCLGSIVLARCNGAGNEIHQASSDEEQPEAKPPIPLAHYYGFTGLEIFKLEDGIRNLLAHDLNGDGRNDLVVFDNGHSRIDVLLQRATEPAGPTVTAITDRVNVVDSHWRFEHVRVSVNKQIGALAVGDFNGDGLADLAYVAPPRELIVRLQSPPAEGSAGRRPAWSERRRYQVTEVSPALRSLVAGDLNGDGLTDLAMLGANETYLFYQKGGALEQPRRLYNTVGKLDRLHIADLDGDGRNDLVYETGDDRERPLRARLQSDEARLGPEISFEVPAFRDLALAEIDAAPGAEILTIENASGRARIYSLAQESAEQQAPPTSQLIAYGFGPGSGGRNRDLAYGDIDGDGRIDVVVTAPEGAQLLLYLQQSGGQLAAARTFPCFAGADMVRCADLDGDNIAELVVGSSQEKTVGVSRMQDGRLAFPTPLPITDEPVALDLADLNADGKPDLVYISKQRAGRATEYHLRGLVRSGSGDWTSAFGDDAAVPLPRQSTDPAGLLAFDPDHDGRADYLVFPSSSNQPPVFLVSGEDAVPAVAGPESVAGIGAARPGGVYTGELDGPAVLVAQRNFARQTRLGDDGRWQGIDQFNADDPRAKIEGAAALDLDGDGTREVVLVDTAGNKLHFLRRNQAVYRPWRELDIGSFSYKAVHVADFNGDARDDVLVFGAAKFGIAYTGHQDRNLRELAGYETPLKDARLSDLVAGDLNHDGRPDVAMIDSLTQYLHVAAYNTPGRLNHALHFKVFEAKSFTGALGGIGREPREILVADATGDGLPDLLLVAHDRILLYPQDPGQPPEATAQPAAAASQP